MRSSPDTGAAKRAWRLTEVPRKCAATDDDAAVIAMIETNLKQRTRLLPSERALAYCMMRDALAHQGASGNGRHTREEIADKHGESPRQIARFIRLTSLNRPLLELVDRGKLQMGGGGDQLSGIPKRSAGSWTTLVTGRTPAIAQAKELRRAYGEGVLTQGGSLQGSCSGRRAKWPAGKKDLCAACGRNISPT